MPFVALFGLAAGFITCVKVLPQTWKAFTVSTNGVNGMAYLTNAVCFSAWLTVGYAENDPLLLVPHTLGALASLGVAVAVWRNQRSLNVRPAVGAAVAFTVRGVGRDSPA